MHTVRLSWGPSTTERTLSLEPGMTRYEMPNSSVDKLVKVDAESGVGEAFNGREFSNLSTLEKQLRASAESHSARSTILKVVTIGLQSATWVALGVAASAGAPILPLVLGGVATTALAMAGIGAANKSSQKAEQLLDHSHAVARLDAASFAVDTEQVPSNLMEWRLGMPPASPAPERHPESGFHPGRRPVGF